MALSFQSIENIETWTQFEIANNDQEHISLDNLLPFFFMAFAMPFSATLFYLIISSALFQKWCYS